MLTRLSRLFRASATPDDGLTQPQREAIADLMHFCIYADNHVAVAEEQILSDTLAGLNWDAGASFEAYESRSIAAARAAKEHSADRDDFFASIRRRLDTKASRALAFEACRRLFGADGNRASGEMLLESRLRQLLG
jgi:uncharacterized tellurite resistance protein B-like protein